LTRLGRIVCATALVACGGPADPCAEYADNEGLHASCVVHRATTADVFEDARCDQAGTLETYCREVWIRAHKQLPQAELMAACDDAECRFFVADTHPMPFTEQVALCGSLRKFSTQCIGHATSRFLGGHPGIEEQHAAFATTALWGSVIGHQVGSFIRCGGVSDCAVVAGGELDCLHAAGSALDPAICASFRPDFPDPGEITTDPTTPPGRGGPPSVPEAPPG
jgi:hypothetical protein